MSKIIKNESNPFKANGQTYNYEVTNKKTGDVEYFTQKGFDCFKDKKIDGVK